MFLAFADAIRNFTRALEQLSTKTATCLDLGGRGRLQMLLATVSGAPASVRKET